MGHPWTHSKTNPTLLGTQKNVQKEVLGYTFNLNIDICRGFSLPGYAKRHMNFIVVIL